MKRNLKKWLVIGPTALFILAFLFTCVGLVSAQSSPQKPMELSISSWIGTRDLQPEAPTWEEMAKDLEAATKGRVKVKIYYAETLGKAKEHYELALKGIADMAYLNVSFTPGRFPVTDLVSFSYAPSAEAMTRGLLELMKKGYLNKEYEKVKLLHVFNGAPCSFIWRKGVKAANSLSELRGRKIRVPGPAAADLMKALGVNPIAMPMPEVYTSLERGVIEGVFTSINTLDVFNLKHVCEEITEVNLLTFGFNLIMNKDTWEKLPKEAKDVLERNTEKYVLMAGQAHDRVDKVAIERNKPKFYKFPPAELAKIRDNMAPIVKAYIEKYEASGFPMKKAAKEYHQFMKEKFGVEPFKLDF